MIIGITGTLGAGKGTVVEHLVKEHGFEHLSARAFFVAGMEQEGIPINRDTMISYANRLRKEHGPRYVFDSLWERASQKEGNVVIESIRTLAEAGAVKAQPGAVLLAVDADPEIRYKRITERKSALDNVSFEEFLAQEEREMHSDDPNKQNLRGCIERADVIIENNGTLEELHGQIDTILKEGLHS